MSITPSSEPVSYSLPAPARPKRVLWRWSFAFTAVVLMFLMWRCGSSLINGRSLSNQAVYRFHEQFNNAEYKQIGQEAEENFHSTEKEQELVDFLTAVHRKLGNAGAESMTNINVNATTNGTFITATYETHFDRGSAVETFTWRRNGGGVKLYAYNIQSKELVLN
jgi:hypothetical protein